MSATQQARSVADLSGGMILATVDIAAPPERVFRALTRPDEVARWWGSPQSYRTESWTSDVRVGGAWSARGRGADGAAFSVAGTFLEVDPPHRIVQTWVPDWDEGAETTLTFTLRAIESGTRLTLRHEGFAGRERSCEAHADGWPGTFDLLARRLAGEPSA